MSNASLCPDCGTPLSPGQPMGLCPLCGLKGALAANANGEPTPDNDIQKVALPCAFGDYELIEEIARGGMGVVYKARQKSLERLVAVKMLLSGPHASTEQLRRFKTEAIAGGAIRHPNIVTVHDVGSRDGMPYLIMDLVDGPSLSRMLRNGPLPPRVAASYVRQVADAVQAAHARGILHRDLKPGNVLIDSENRPRVTDFGLAKNLGDDSSQTASGQVYGSPSYMPPEQAAGKRERMGVASDVYALGATLYHALTGRPPFVAQNVSATLKQVETAEPIAPRLLNPSIPRDLETICLKCLQKEPDRRYASAQEMADDLGHFLRNEPIVARPAGRVEKLWRWGRRNRLAAAFVGTVCAALGVSLWLLILVNFERERLTSLSAELRQTMDEKDGAAKRAFDLLKESLDGMWANGARRTLHLKSEDAGAIVERAVPAITNRASARRWKMGLMTDEAPWDRLSQHGAFLAAIEDRASRLLGHEVRVDVRLYKFQEDLRDDLARGDIDFGRLGARMFIQLRRTSPQVMPLVMPSFNSKTGILFTRAGSGIETISDIRGRSMAFGDTNSTISYWAQIKLAQHGITATNLARYDFLDSTLDFIDDVMTVGYSNAVSHIGYLHSHAQVIEGVLAGRYDVGVANEKAFKIHRFRGLVEITNSSFISSRTLFVARPHFDSRYVGALINLMTNLTNTWLQALPEASPAFEAVQPDAYKVEEDWLDRINVLFPHKPPPPLDGRIP